MLGDCLKDAINICVKYLNDLPLAIALCRIKEGSDDGPVLKELLRKRVLPLAFEQGDRWLASWAFWMLGRKDLSVQVIVLPLPELLGEEDVKKEVTGEVNRCAAGNYEDASLALLFAELKGKSMKTAIGSSRIPIDKEHRFVLYMNKMLIRMGEQASGSSAFIA